LLTGIVATTPRLLFEVDVTDVQMKGDVA